MSRSQKWKLHERLVAAALGTTRLLHRDGRAGADMEIPTHSVQVKQRKKMPNWFLDAWDQAVGDVAGGREPALVFVLAPGRGHKVRRWVVLDFEQWVQSLGRGNSDMPLERAESLSDERKALQ